MFLRTFFANVCEADMDPRVKAAMDQAEHVNMGQRKFEKLNALCGSHDQALNLAGVMRITRFVSSKNPSDVPLHAIVIQKICKMFGRLGTDRDHPEVAYIFSSCLSV